MYNQRLDFLTIERGQQKKIIELYQGDITDVAEEQGFDTLIISALPNDYIPTHKSVIGALNQKGVSVQALADDKARDLRQTSSCWVSKVFDSQQIKYKQIICFEPLYRGTPAEVVGDIFRSLIAFENDGIEIKNIAMPLVATGDQKTSLEDMLKPLMEAAFRWMELGLEVDKLSIFVRSENKAQQTLEVFQKLKTQFQNDSIKTKSGYFYDVFISYSHENIDVADVIVSKLKALKPDIKIFLDREELQTGVAWQQKMFEALDECRKVITLFSPTYLTSKVCNEEYNIALYRDRDAIESILFPIYIKKAPLPTYMKLTQYVDCREVDYDQIDLACQQIIYELEHKPTKDAGDRVGLLKAEDSYDHSMVDKLSNQLQECNEKIAQLERKIDQILELVSQRN